MDGTRERLLAAAKDEFLKYGYRGASLRRIAAVAGVTTGAIYGCFGSKQELFDALVGGTYELFMRNYMAAQNRFTDIPEAQQPDNVGTASSHYLDWAVTFMLEHRDEFRLLLTCSEGTRFSGMVDEMVRVEVEATDRFMRVLDSLGRAPDGMSPMLEHILVSSMFTGMFEIVIHDMEPEAAITYSRQLRDFLHGRLAQAARP